MKPWAWMVLVTLVAIALILLIILIVLAIPYSKQSSTSISNSNPKSNTSITNSNNSRDDTKPPKECEKCKESRICTSEDCVRSAAHLRLILNTNVDPCDDFYEYACGNWPKEHLNLDSIYKASKQMGEKLKVVVQKFLKSKNKENDPLPVKNARNFYKSCLDFETKNKLGLSVLDKTLQELGLPFIPSFFSTGNDSDAFKFNWLKTIALVKKTIDLDIFLGFAVKSGRYNVFENAMYLDQPSQIVQVSLVPALPSFKVRKTDRIVKVLKYILKNGTLKQPDEVVFQEAAKIIENMRTQVSKIQKEASALEYQFFLSKEKLNVVQDRIDTFLLQSINITYPDLLKDYVGYMFEGTNITADMNKDEVYVSNITLDYIPKIIRLNHLTSDIDVELYVWFLTIVEMIFNTSSDFIEFYASQEAANQQICNLGEKCFKLVKKFMDLAVTYGVPDTNFSETTKPEIEEMINGIRDSFAAYVNTQPWIDLKSEQNILEKNSEMVKFIGFPNWTFEREALEKYYEGYVANENTFLANMINMIKIQTKRQFSTLRSTNTRYNELFNPLAVNAHHYADRNAIIIPMAILKFPLYNLGLEMLHYGAIGTILAHEWIHGFEDNGSKFDKFGNFNYLNKLLSAQSYMRFNFKKYCFIDQYDNYTLYGLKKYMTGWRTVTENLADNGGIRHSYTAYQNYIKKNGPEPSLPGFENFTSNQLFFIAFPSFYCQGINNLEEFSRLIDADKHAPGKIRVLNVLKNFPEFSETFNCSLGSNMNPNRKRCQLW